jgi:hypothetical protein
MTRRRDELRDSSYQELMNAVERMSPTAISGLRDYQSIRTAGGKPRIQYSPHHGWVVTDLLAGPPPWEKKP